MYMTFLLLTVLVCSDFSELVPQSAAVKSDFSELIPQAMPKTDKPAVRSKRILVFTADWCVQCERWKENE